MPSNVTEVDICNLALSHLGEASITALNDGTERANACALHYPNTRDEVLRSHRWNFAIFRATVTASVTAPAFGWDKQYAIPADCLRILEVNDSEFGDEISDQYVVENGYILTNATTMNLVYVGRFEDTDAYDPIFVKALALKLAVSLSETIRGTTEKTGELLAAYERVTAPLARRVDANEGRRRKGMLPLNSTWIHARNSDEMPSLYPS